jgi:hypothetical protein
LSPMEALPICCHLRLSDLPKSAELRCWLGLHSALWLLSHQPTHVSTTLRTSLTTQASDVLGQTPSSSPCPHRAQSLATHSSVPKQRRNKRSRRCAQR